MSTEVGSRAEAELAVERLMEHFENWLLQQPEILLIWMQDRNTRKRVEAALAKGFTTIPARGMVEMNRSTRRRVLAALDAQEKEWWSGVRI